MQFCVILRTIGETYNQDLALLTHLNYSKPLIEEVASRQVS